MDLPACPESGEALLYVVAVGLEVQGRQGFHKRALFKRKGALRR